MTVKAGVFDDGMFDWQTMRIPTGNIWSVKTLHGFVFHDDIF